MAFREKEEAGTLEPFLGSDLDSGERLVQGHLKYRKPQICTVCGFWAIEILTTVEACKLKLSHAGLQAALMLFSTSLICNIQQSLWFRPKTCTGSVAVKISA